MTSGAAATGWAPAATLRLPCHLPAEARPGRLDERERRLTHEELAVARWLVEQGHDVRSLREARSAGRTADLEVCGLPVEVKSFDGLEVRGGRPPSPRSVFNQLVRAEGQAPVVVVFGKGSGLTAGAARAGMAGYAARFQPSPFTDVHVLGDGFQLGWARVPVLERPSGRGRGDAAERRAQSRPVRRSPPRPSGDAADRRAAPRPTGNAADRRPAPRPSGDAAERRAQSRPVRRSPPRPTGRDPGGPPERRAPPQPGGRDPGGPQGRRSPPGSGLVR